jgi:hypothetical protein
MAGRCKVHRRLKQQQNSPMKRWAYLRRGTLGVVQSGLDVACRFTACQGKYDDLVIADPKPHR